MHFFTSRETPFLASKKAPFFDPQGRPKERVLLESGSKTDNFDTVFSFVKICYFCVFFDEPWWGKIGLSHHSVCKNHEFSWGRNLAPTRVTWVRRGGKVTRPFVREGLLRLQFRWGGTPPFNTNAGSQEGALRGRTASKGPVGRRKTRVSCDTVAILVKRCIFSALA